MNCLTLQTLCCQKISQTSEICCQTLFADLNQPCLAQLVETLSLYDLLQYEEFLRSRGVDTKIALNALVAEVFLHVEAYPIKSTVFPHFLNIFLGDSWRWSLSRLLYRRVLLRVIEQYDCCDGRVGKDFYSALTCSYPDIVELCTPPFLLRTKQTSSNVPDAVTIQSLLDLAVSKILHVLVDVKTCSFLLSPLFSRTFELYCGGLRVLSLPLKNSPLLCNFLRKVKKYAQCLERICVYGLRGEDMDYFDEIMSICSGVVEYSCSNDGKEESIMLVNDDVTNTEVQDKMCKEKKDDSEHLYTCFEQVQSDSECSAITSDFDLMDDAVLFGTLCPPCKYDSTEGIAKADLKFTNLVRNDSFVSVLNHHLKSWLSLREFHLALPVLCDKSVHGICTLLRRLQLQSFTLSSCDFRHIYLEEILVAVANFRHTTPLEKLIFVDLHAENIMDTFVSEQLAGKSHSEIEELAQPLRSSRLAEHGHFQGTRVLEFFSCSFELKTEVMIRQFILLNSSLLQLYLSSSLSTYFVRSILRSLTQKAHPLTCIGLENWKVMKTTDSEVLVDLLRSVRPSLQILNMKGCLSRPFAFSLPDLMDLLVSCDHLYALDLSENVLRSMISSSSLAELGIHTTPYTVGVRGDNAVQILHKIAQMKHLKDLVLRKTCLNYNSVIQSFRVWTDMKHNHQTKAMLDALDLRGNSFYESDRLKHQHLFSSIAKRVLCDYSLSDDVR